MSRKPLPKVIRPAGAPTRAASEPAFDKVEAEPKLAVSSAPIANDAAPSASSPPVYDKALAAKRRALARKIVDRHRNYAAVGGLVPLPVVSIASLTAINMRMIRQLSTLYGVPFERDRTRSLIVGIIGGAVPAGLGTATSTTLMWIIPGGLFVGAGVSAVSAAALTRGIGLVFIESFEGETS